MSRKDMDYLILRPSKLHILMAELRSIGVYIDNSGIDLSWIEANLYGPVTVHHIIEGKHVRRGVEGHLITLQAMFTLYQEEFFLKYSDLQSQIDEVVEERDHACTHGDIGQIGDAHATLTDSVESLQIMTKMSHCDATRKETPLFSVMRQYMNMVMEMMMFILAVRTGAVRT
jgi:hypothetical protein